ncbi:MAG: hypothetical protein ACE5JI_21120, partial [Acidobacteriota bacterium]
MNRHFLAALVREVAPGLLGWRARGVTGWSVGTGVGGLTVMPRNKKRDEHLVVSLLPEAAGFFVGTRPACVRRYGDETSLPGFKRHLSGASLVAVEVADRDRSLCLRWRRIKPAGSQAEVDLIVEWFGTRTAAYLVGLEDRTVLDVVSPGKPRCSSGTPFRPPPGGGSLPSGVNETQALRAASGLGAVLAQEISSFAKVRGVALDAAYEEMMAKLEQAPCPVLLRPSGGEPWGKGRRWFLSPIPLSPSPGRSETRFPTFNEA